MRVLSGLLIDPCGVVLPTQVLLLVVQNTFQKRFLLLTSTYSLSDENNRVLSPNLVRFLPFQSVLMFFYDVKTTVLYLRLEASKINVLNQ
jgi:hypothetical protein